ncbi:hypothetical protein ABXJ76_17255 [Methylobacter sp. G7]|uniref:hypothetical protein n=1 Tax=Methylobacter sp. G7 TaxID=3230117 RepID=UPI003D800BFF
MNHHRSKAKRAFFSGSIRRQLAWSFGSVALIIMVGLAGLLYDRQRNFLYSAALQQSKSLTMSLASSTSWVLANETEKEYKTPTFPINTPAFFKKMVSTLNFIWIS